jgi:hypothetical protein
VTTRRGFLGAMLAAAAAPAFVKAGVLMPVRKIIVPPTLTAAPLVLWGDGVTDDTAAMQAAIRGEPVINRNGSKVNQAGTIFLAGGTYRISQTIHLEKGRPPVQVVGGRLDGHSMLGGPLFHVAHGADATLRDMLIVGAPCGMQLAW